ncbi:protein dip1 [Aspergillus terreus]|uniref:Protein dip1 n=1 Tax=Aspergillus terreus TaxID=33178 RepID=A0A5M3Z0Y5_ASPTE|nr:hypothetical protein ATETN484_0005051300 [Aspergillus terreus]GFF17178.1 protein dip1 [Aspergillus terreus]
MEFEVSLENEQQFWDELQEIVSAPCSSEDLIDNALRSYLNLATKYKGAIILSAWIGGEGRGCVGLWDIRLTAARVTTDEYLQSELAVSRCSYKLLSSTVFADHADYVRRQMIYGLLQEDEPDTLAVIASFLIFDGRRNEAVLRVMNEEGSFPRLLELLQVQNKKRGDDEAGLHRLLMDLLYEMSRIQRIKIEDLGGWFLQALCDMVVNGEMAVLVDDDFIKSLFDIIEDLSYDVNDPYHYPVIRVLLVLNEQYMISAHDPVDDGSSSNVLTNKVIKILSMHGNLYKTFGENIILLINREAETSLQLLTLKLLYLIFTTPRTYEYFYTNDLHVLVDILIRNLLDLPEEASALRHTYLRVLYPLLAHTQLKMPPHYKREELKRMLNLLVRGRLSSGDADHEKVIVHFDDVDETTRRLVLRCTTVDWMRDPPEEQSPDVDTATTTPLDTSQTLSSPSTDGSSPETTSPTRLDEHHPKLDAHRNLSQAQRLGMHLERTSTSSLSSVQEVATQHEKPGVITPSRTNTDHLRPTSPTKPKPKIKPLPPKTRRWRGRRTHPDDEITPTETPISASALGSPVIAPVSTPDSVLQQHEQHVDRRNSTTTSGLAPPPVPAHARRSASNPPPAVPPPRRSTHPAMQPHHISSHCTPVSSPSRAHPPQQGPPASGKPSQPPEPPRTRRTGRGRHVLSDSGDKSAETSVGPGEKLDGATVSVEEAVQNVSLH